MKLKSLGLYWRVLGIVTALLVLSFAEIVVEERFRPSGLEPLPTAEIVGSVDQALERSKAVTAEQFIRVLGQYLSGLPWVMFITIGIFVGWMTAAALPRQVTRAVTEGRFQYFVIALFGFLSVAMPLIGPIHPVMRDHPFIFFIVFNIVLNGGLYSFWRWVFIPNENRRVRTMGVGVNTVEELVDQLKGYAGALAQTKKDLEDMKLAVRREATRANEAEAALKNGKS